MGDRDAEFDLIARDKTAPGVDSAANRLGRLSKSAKDTQGGITGLMKHVETSFGRMSKSANAWGKSGDTVGRGFSGRVLGSLAGMVEKTAGIGASMGKAMSGGLSAAGPQVTAALIGVAVAAAAVAGPLMGAALAAGVLLGVGGAVIAGGILAAAKSPAVAAAWSTFGERAKAAFADFGKPFEGPLAKAATTFGDAMGRMAPTINGLGKSLAPIIDKLAPALASMAEKALPGIARAAEASKPIFDALAKALPGLGTSISKFFDSVSGGAPGAALAIGDIVRVIGALIEGIGSTIHFLSDMYGAVKAAATAINGVVAAMVYTILSKLGTIVDGAAKAFGWIPGLGGRLAQAAEQFHAFQGRVNAELAGITNKVVTVTIRTVKIVENYTSTSPGRVGGPGTAFAAFASWYPAAAGGGGAAFAGAPAGGARTGGPSEVNVTNVVSLDGRPFREMVSRAVVESERRSSWRARVGRR